MRYGVTEWYPAGTGSGVLAMAVSSLRFAGRLVRRRRGSQGRVGTCTSAFNGPRRCCHGLLSTARVLPREPRVPRGPRPGTRFATPGQVTLPLVVVLASVFAQAWPENAPPLAAGSTAGRRPQPPAPPPLPRPRLGSTPPQSCPPSMPRSRQRSHRRRRPYSSPRPIIPTRQTSVPAHGRGNVAGYRLGMGGGPPEHRADAPYAPDPAFPNLGGAALDIGLGDHRDCGIVRGPRPRRLGRGRANGCPDWFIRGPRSGGPGRRRNRGRYLRERVGVIAAHRRLPSDGGHPIVGDHRVLLGARFGRRARGASAREKRKLSLAFLLGGDTIGGSGIEAAFHASDGLALALQVISGDGAGTEGSPRLQFFALALPRSGIDPAAGPHLTAGNARDDVASLQEKPAAAAGALAAVGWQFRGEHGFLFQAELSTVYAPSARNVRQAGERTIFPGEAP